MTLRFYPYGPAAARGDTNWETPDGISGCWVAHRVGADIPRTAYEGADIRVSQYHSTRGIRGLNYTAILPVEV